MYRYFIGTGSNIEPEENTARMVTYLLGVSPELHLSSVIQTEPVGVTGGSFLNMCVCVTSEMNGADLKERCNAIEEKLGRDRSIPGGKKLSRTADIDILFALAPGEFRVDPSLLPREPYLLPLAMELIYYLGLETSGEPVHVPGRRQVRFQGGAIGNGPVTVVRDGETVQIFEQGGGRGNLPG